MDSLVVPTARFKLLYVGFVIGHGRREILRSNVTARPTAAWVVQQLCETFPGDASVRYLIRDNDPIFSDQVGETISRIGIDAE